MARRNEEIDEKFVEHQRQKLEALQGELVRMRRGMREDEQERSEEYQDTQPDSGDQSQYMFIREMDATVEEQVERRLEVVERALSKIAEGTYGVDDETGEPIARGRLEAVPEALHTVEVQQRREKERRPPV